MMCSIQHTQHAIKCGYQHYEDVPINKYLFTRLAIILKRQKNLPGYY